MHKPTVPYGQWDPNWDFKADDKSELKQDGIKTKRGPKRHIILVRHGQYVEVKGDANRILTPLGREQAEETGKRLARMIRSNNMNVTSLRVSNLTRAKKKPAISYGNT
jgi:serine/threonine-protein phosphatase PGAM5